MEGKQLNIPHIKCARVCAPSRPWTQWKAINWKYVEKWVRKLQVRIAKAVELGRHGKVKSLQWILTHSFYARLLAVKRVVTNKGKKTPGVDGVIWRTNKQKMQAVYALRRKGYKPLPLRRIYIEKKNGKLRPLGIPPMSDRAQQALYLLALLPVAETTADLNSYGFRPMRSCADAIGQCFISLAKSYSPKWILEADIKSCFDEISHPWILENIPMDKRILKAWLKAGYMEGGRVFPTKAGTPQGGIASPVLANMTLDGLEQVCRNAVPTRHKLGQCPKVNVIRYADDFIVTAGSRQMIADEIVPAIRKYLKERGLTLSEEKTRITHIEEGFDFLGQNVRKHQNKLSINPSKKSVRSILDKTKEILKAHRGNSAWHMIKKLNPVIRGWANYHSHIYASETFSYLDSCIFENLWNWARRRHKAKGKRWTRKKYFRKHGNTSWSFFATQKSKDGCFRTIDLLRACSIKTKPHAKIRAQANPYSNKWDEYFQRRKRKKDMILPSMEWVSQ